MFCLSKLPEIRIHAKNAVLFSCQLRLTNWQQLQKIKLNKIILVYIIVDAEERATVKSVNLSSPMWDQFQFSPNSIKVIRTIAIVIAIAKCQRAKILLTRGCCSICLEMSWITVIYENADRRFVMCPSFTVMEGTLYLEWIVRWVPQLRTTGLSCSKTSLPRRRFFPPLCGEGRNTSSPKNACVGGYSKTGQS